MQSTFYHKETTCKAPFQNYSLIKGVVVFMLVLTSMQATLQAQQSLYAKPSWWFGAASAANVNFYRGSTQQLNYDFTAPVAFHDGVGAGLYFAPLVEYVHPDSKWGVGLQIGYDSRYSKFKQVITPCNCPADLSTNLSYITVEPSLRLAPFGTDFYLFGGPRLAFNLEKAFTYKLGINPSHPEQPANPEVKGEFSAVNKTLLSVQIGAGYDIPLSSPYAKTQTVLSPFVSFQPYIGQSPRSVETWNITTLRAGVALKFGCGRKVSTSTPEPVEAIIPPVQFAVYSPKNIAVDRRVRETFPLLNYVFFDIGSTEIPEGYVMLRKNQVKDFKEDQLEVFAPKNLSGRSRREMIAYYNVLNILGDRMGKNPGSAVTLVGSSEKGPEDGKAMAESIKRYWVEIFGIEASRISVAGRDKPKIPSEKPGATRELELLREGDRRVTIESNSPALLMEFQSGPNAPLKPVEIMSVQDAPMDSYVTFNAAGAAEAFTSWMLEIRDEKGLVQYFGPYTREKVSLPGRSILGSRSEGDYRVAMVGQTKGGQTITQEKNVHMVLWTPPEDEQGMRYSVVFDFNSSKTIKIYEKYLSNVVAPKIPSGALVIIHGYTDIIGDAVYNQKLSLARANEVKDILSKSLSKSGRSDVKFDVFGFGEDETLSPFDNNLPEQRFYNRSVLIDIIPIK